MMSCEHLSGVNVQIFFVQILFTPPQKDIIAETVRLVA